MIERRPCGIGYDSRNGKVLFTYYNKGKGYVRFYDDMSLDEYDEFFESGKWEKRKLSIREIFKSKRCNHEFIRNWEDGQDRGRVYCSKCNVYEYLDTRSPEEIKREREEMLARAEKLRLVENIKLAKDNLDNLILEFKSKYGEKIKFEE